MAPCRWPLSNYIFELLEVNLGGARVLIQLHPKDVEALLESVTAHTEKGAGTKTILCVGLEEKEEGVFVIQHWTLQSSDDHMPVSRVTGVYMS